MSAKRNPRPLAGGTGAVMVSLHGATIANLAPQAPVIQARRSLRLARGAEHLHRCGPRAVAEFLCELAQAHGIEAAMLDRLDRWRSLAPQHVAAVLDHYAGGRQFPPALSRVAP